MSEEQGAKLHQQQQRNRAKYRRLRNRELRGDPQRRKALAAAWDPVTKKGC